MAAIRYFYTLIRFPWTFLSPGQTVSDLSTFPYIPDAPVPQSSAWSLAQQFCLAMPMKIFNFYQNLVTCIKMKYPFWGVVQIKTAKWDICGQGKQLKFFCSYIKYQSRLLFIKLYRIKEKYIK